MNCCAPWRAAPSSSRPFGPQTIKRKRNSSSVFCRKHLPGLVLHDSLDAAGIDTKFARAARKRFCNEIGQTTEETRIPDIARTALHIGSEDDSLISHSSVPLPVDPFVHRLDDLSMGFCSLYGSTHSSPDLFLANLDKYLYVHKGFHRADAMSDIRALYLHSVLTCRSGSVVMLSLIYSEILKMLRACGILDFDVEIYFPRDLISLPRGYHKQKAKLLDQTHVMTSKSLLVEILRNLKDAFWPFPYDISNSLFLRAAQVANQIHGLGIVGDTYSKSFSNTSGLEIASAKAAQHRLGRGVWTNVRFGDMRRALAACERLILLDIDYKELRDYAVLLYHCGYYQQCWEYLKLYQSLQRNALESPSSLKDDLEDEVLEKLITRLSLILAEEGWSAPVTSRNYWGKSLQRQQKLLQPLFSLLIDQVTVGVKFLWGLECLDKYLWLVDEMKIQKNSNLPQMVLGSSSSKTSSSTYDSSRFARPDIWRSGCPINSILQRCGDGIVVFGRGEEDAVSLQYLAAEGLDGRRVGAVDFEVGVNEGEGGDV